MRRFDLGWVESMCAFNHTDTEIWPIDAFRIEVALKLKDLNSFNSFIFKPHNSPHMSTRHLSLKFSGFSMNSWSFLLINDLWVAVGAGDNPSTSLARFPGPFSAALYSFYNSRPTLSINLMPYLLGPTNSRRESR